MTKIKISETLKLLGFLLILFSPLDYYTIPTPFISISIYRFFFILTFLLFILQILINHSLKSYKLIYLLICLAFFSLIIGSLQIKEINNNNLPFVYNEMMGIILVLMFINIYEKEDVNALLKCFVFSQVSSLLFSIYIYYQFVVNLNLIVEDPILKLLGINQNDPDSYRRFTSGIIPRLTLPYAKSPHFAIAIASTLIISVFRLFKKKNFLYFSITLISFVLLIGSLTKTIYVSIFLTALITVLLKYILWKFRPFKIKKQLFGWIFVFGVFVFMFLLVPGEIRLELAKRFMRLAESGTEDRHFLLLKEAIYHWLIDIRTFFIGIGIGNNPEQGFFTFLPPASFLNSYLTILAQRGIIGLLLALPLYTYLFYHLFLSLKNKTKYGSVLFSIYLNVLIAFIFYELRTIIVVWLIIAICFVYIKSNIIFNDFSDNSSF